MAHSIWPLSAPTTFRRNAIRPSMMLPFCDSPPLVYVQCVLVC